MGKFYRKLPSELLDLPLDAFRMAWLVWYNYELERQRQMDQIEAEAKARMMAG